VRIEQHMIGEIHARRYAAKDPKYAILISHGLGGHGGMYDRFGTHHSTRGVEVWSYDAPGHGQSTTTRPRGQYEMQEWVDAGLAYVEHIKRETGLPVFTLGSSLGVAAAYACLASEEVKGCILMGATLVPGTKTFNQLGAKFQNDGVKALIDSLGRTLRFDVKNFVNYDEDYGYKGAEDQKRLDPWITWSYDLASFYSFFNYQPGIPVDRNNKPILVTSGSEDAMFSESRIREMAKGIAGPVEVNIVEGGSHQLLMFDTERFSTAVHEFVGKQL